MDTDSAAEGARSVDEPPSAAADTATTTGGRSAMLRSMLRTVLVDLAPSLITFYGLRAAGVHEYYALLAATIVAGIPVVYGIVKDKRLDPFAGYLMLVFGLGLAVALATDDPQLILAGQTAVNGVAGLVFLISAAIGKPLTEVAAARFMKNANLSDEMRANLHRLHQQITVLIGALLMVDVVARLIVVFTLPFDVASGLVAVIGALAIPVIFVIVGVVVGRFRARAKAAAPA